MSQRKLTIGVDARLIKLRRGMGNYVHSLLREYSQIEFDHHIIAYVDDSASVQHVPRSSQISVEVVPPSFYPICEQIALPKQVERDEVDVLHCPANTAPLRLTPATKLVLTIHDVMYLQPASVLPVSPSLYQRLGRRYRSLVVPRVAKQAACIIAVSNFTKSDILSHIQLDESRIRVIYEAQGQDVRRISDEAISAVLDRYSITKPYMFALGAVDPRKNTQRIIQAFAKFKNATSSRFKLVICGLSDVDRDKFQSAAKALGVLHHVHFLPFISREDLIAFYGGAEMLVYPTFYEGFGFPVLEAMGCGTPVITSGVTSIPEVAGDAALFVDPSDDDEITTAISSLAYDAQLSNAYREKGTEQVRKFSWKQVARETLEVYEALAYNQ
jgi:glycosyltransferase involved in cell wall biosynthesis